jgi:hypothetical protein
MKKLSTAAFAVLAFSASGAFAQGVLSPRTPDTQDSYSAQPSPSTSSVGASQVRDSRPGDLGGSPWQGATMAPAWQGQDIRNANSALWGVGG